MSAVNPLPSGTSSDKRSYEPSMEEILASIRRIIADDQGIPIRGTPVGDPASTVESSHELLRMPAPHRPTTSPPEPTPMRQPAASAEPEPPPPPDADDEFALTLHGATAHGPIAAPQYPSPEGRPGDGGVNSIAKEPAPPEPSPPAAADLAFDEHALPPEDPEQDAQMFDEPIAPRPMVDPTPLFSASTDAAVSSAFSMLAASRLADNSEELMTIAKEMIRPMLRAWLDDNLPSMVERMVRAEIERVARGGR